MEFVSLIQNSIMRKSKFSDDRRRQIILEKEQDSLTVQEVCKRYKISVNTFYLWKRMLFSNVDDLESSTRESVVLDSRDSENKTLRRLYINLSAHNYELAKFLEK